MEAGGDFGEGVSTRGGVCKERGRGLRRSVLLFQVSGTHFFVDGGLQETVRRDRAIPEQTVETSLHRTHHPLQTEKEEEEEGVNNRL